MATFSQAGMALFPRSTFIEVHTVCEVFDSCKLASSCAHVAPPCLYGWGGCVL